MGLNNEWALRIRQILFRHKFCQTPWYASKTLSVKCEVVLSPKRIIQTEVSLIRNTRADLNQVKIVNSQGKNFKYLSKSGNIFENRNKIRKFRIFRKVFFNSYKSVFACKNLLSSMVVAPLLVQYISTIFYSLVNFKISNL